MEVVVPRPHSHCCLLFHHTPDQMEDEALQCAEVCPAELIYYRIHSPYHLPLVWLTLGGKNNPKESDGGTVHLQGASAKGGLDHSTTLDDLIMSLPMALRNSSYSSKVMRGLGRSRSHCLRTLAMTWML